MTRLRTKWGINIDYLSSHFPKQTPKIIPSIEDFISQNKLEQEKNIITLSKEGKFIADYIIGQLFIV